MRRLWLASVGGFAVLLWGCGGGTKGPLGSGPSVPTGIVQGRLVSSGRQNSPRFLARIQGARHGAHLSAAVSSSGFFRITGVPAGPQVLTLEDRQNLEGAVILCFVRPNQVNDVGVVETQQLGLLSGIVREVDREGKALGPVRDAWVTAQPIGSEQDTLDNLPARPFFTDRTNSAGAYSMLLPAGTYLVKVEHPDFETVTDWATVEALMGVSLNFGLNRRAQDTGAVFGRVQARVGDSDVPVPGALVALIPEPQGPQPLPVEVRPDHVTVGQIISGFANPMSGGHRGGPGAGFRPNNGPERLPIWFTFTSAEGTYEINNLPTNNYQAIALKMGFGMDEKQVFVAPNARVEVNFLLTARLGVVQGTVTDAVSREPIAEAWVFAIRKGEHFFIWDGWERDDDDPHGGGWHHGGLPAIQGTGRQGAGSGLFPPMPPFEPAVRAGTLTDQNGHYQLMLPAGEYFLVAAKEGYQWEGVEITIGEGGTVTQDFSLTPLFSPPGGGEWSQLSVELRVAPDQVSVGESVTMTLEVENAGQTPVTLQFNTPLASDFAIVRDGREIWRFSRHVAVIQGGAQALVVPHPVTLPPGRKVFYSGTWQQVDDDGNQVPPGEYLVRGYLLTDPVIPAKEDKRIRIGEAND